MKLILLISILGLFALLALAVVVALYRHKNSVSNHQGLMDESGQIVTSLSPDGNVMINGELWPARSVTQEILPAGTRIRVIGCEEHLLLVKPLNQD